MTSILHGLFDLTLLPARRRIAELGLIQVMAEHRIETLVDLTALATADFIDDGLHVVVDTALWYPTKRGERVVTASRATGSGKPA